MFLIGMSSERNWFPTDRDMAFTEKILEEIRRGDSTLDFRRLHDGNVEAICIIGPYEKPSDVLKRNGIVLSNYGTLEDDYNVLESFWAVAFVTNDAIDIYNIHSSDVPHPSNQTLYSRCLDSTSGYEIPIGPEWERLRIKVK